MHEVTTALIPVPTIPPLDRVPLQDELDRITGPDRWKARVVAETASTNTELLDEVRGKRLEQRLLLVAERQSAGRGRLGRRWHSTPGLSLTVSFALPIARPLAALDGVTLACGLAVHAALATIGVRAALKWPNDVLVEGRKLAGILVEAQADGNRTLLVVGIGINLLPSGAAAYADLHGAGATTVDRARIAAIVAAALDRATSRFAVEGFATFAREWNAVDAWRDREVELRGRAGEPVLRGIARGVDDEGRLLLEVDGRIAPQLAGDLSLRLQAATPA